MSIQLNRSAQPQEKIEEGFIVSVAIVIQNDNDIALEACRDILAILSSRYLYYELLVIDNGSADSSIETIRELQAQEPNVRLIVLSREYESDVAFTAALDNSIGDYTVLMDIEHDPAALIPEMIAKAESGYDIVIAERKTRAENPFLYTLSAKLFYKLYSRMTGFDFAPNASNFRVMTRRVVNSMTRIKSKGRYFKHVNAQVGFQQLHFPYERVYRRDNARKKESTFSLLFKATDVFVSHSLFPLRLAALAGVIASTLNFLFILYVFIVSLVKKQVAEGWVSTSLVNSTMFCFLFLILAVISEYIARILIESKDQPLYFVADEYQSDIMSKAKKKINVV